MNWKLVGALGQTVLDDRLHPRLAEGAARLLVGEHVAQSGHLRGEVGEVLVRVVDDAEPFMQRAQALHGVAGRMFHGLADPMRHRIKPLVDRPRHLGLASRERLGHGVNPPRGLALGAQHLGEALLELVGPDRVRHGEFRATPPRARDHDRNHNQQDEDERTEADQRIDDAHRPVAQHDNDLVHAAL
ncbi:hypothetical protein ABIA45_004973 [Bradyrhizobium sp. USDA 336]